MSTITLTVNGVRLDRSSGEWATEYRRHDLHWRHGQQYGVTVVAVRGDCCDLTGVEHLSTRPITPIEESMCLGQGYRARVIDSGDAAENARRAVYAHLIGEGDYVTVSGRRAAVRLV